MSTIWAAKDDDFLRENYPQRGKVWCAGELGRSIGAIRTRAATLGLKQDKSSPFFAEWQQRAAASKVGKPRPEQAAVMRGMLAAGKMKITAEGRKAISAAVKLQHATNHPRGMAGKRHSAATKSVISASSAKRWRDMTPEMLQARSKKQIETRTKNGTMAPNRKRGTWKAAWREIGGIHAYFRSKWEANYARYLQWLKERGEIVAWEHEAETFWFAGVKRGCVSYLPDFRVTTHKGVEYHEVKGWMDDRSKTKIRRMAKYHPSVKLLVIDAKAYKVLDKQVSRLVPGWE